MAKKAKTYVDSKDTALHLAGLVSDDVERKSEMKRKECQEKAAAKTSTQHKRHRSDSERMKRAKEAILAKQAQVRKRRAHERKINAKATDSANIASSSRKEAGGDSGRSKRVSFA